MTELEAYKVIELLKHADGGCPFCVYDMLTDFKDLFPKWAKLVEEEPKYKECRETVTKTGAKPRD